ncbi:50S ribosomal protein L16 [Candidatus Shapirobacteria bacterium]|nr:50S ribosomal protein L16 [Candidatus Shapirobacteria bacterium]
MLAPKKSKYRKSFRGKMRGKSYRGSTLAFGEFGLKSLGRGWFKSNQIEAARRVITGFTKRSGKVWIRVFPDKPITKKSPGAPMGAGKGEIDTHVAVVRPGKILFELGGVPEKIAREALGLAAQKVPFKTKIIARET